jgi:hypothetical protein
MLMRQFFLNKRKYNRGERLNVKIIILSHENNSRILAIRQRLV